MRDLNAILFDKLREYDRYMRMDRASGALFSSGNSGSGMDNPAFQRDIVLVLLSAHEEGLSQRELAEHMRVSQSTLSVMLDKLEADGYLERKGDSADKRKKVLSITKTGMQRAEEVHQQCVVMRERLYRNLTDAEKEEMIRLLDKIMDREPEEGTQTVSPFKVVGNGLTCGPDGCHIG